MFDRPVTPLARLKFFECLAALFLDAHRPARTLSFRILTHFAQIKANQQALGIGHVSDKTAQWQR
jgi:hypothetical protein